MSKSKGNTVDPQDLIKKYGADTVRLFTMFASPPEQSLEWNDDAVEGSFRFLRRVWKLVSDEDKQILFADWVSGEKLSKFDWSSLDSDSKDMRAEIHVLLKQANHDVNKYQFNTVIAAAMKIVNLVQPLSDKLLKQSIEKHVDESMQAVYVEATQILLRLLAPIVPHITHALWQSLGHTSDILDAEWPVPDEGAMVKENVDLVVQVNGKLRGKISVTCAANKDEIEKHALQDENVQRHIEGKELKKVIVVPGRLINIVVK